MRFYDVIAVMAMKTKSCCGYELFAVVTVTTPGVTHPLLSSDSITKSVSERVNGGSRSNNFTAEENSSYDNKPLPSVSMLANT